MVGRRGGRLLIREQGKKFVMREECVRSRAPELSTVRTVKTQRWQAQTGSREKEVERRREKEMPGRKMRPNKQRATERAVKIQRCQGQTGLLESGIIRQGWQEREGYIEDSERWRCWQPWQPGGQAPVWKLPSHGPKKGRRLVRVL